MVLALFLDLVLPTLLWQRINEKEEVVESLSMYVVPAGDTDSKTSLYNHLQQLSRKQRDTI